MSKKFIRMAKTMAKSNAFDFCFNMSVDGDMTFDDILNKELWDSLSGVYLCVFAKEVNKLFKHRKKEIEREGAL